MTVKYRIVIDATAETLNPVCEYLFKLMKTKKLQVIAIGEEIEVLVPTKMPEPTVTKIVPEAPKPIPRPPTPIVTRDLMEHSLDKKMFEFVKEAHPRTRTHQEIKDFLIKGNYSPLSKSCLPKLRLHGIVSVRGEGYRWVPHH